MISQSLIPTFETDELAKLMVLYFYLYQRIQLDETTISYRFISPRPGCKYGFEVYDTTGGKTVSLRMHVLGFKEVGDIHPYRQEMLQGTSAGESGETWVSIAILPRVFPVLERYQNEGVDLDDDDSGGGDTGGDVTYAFFMGQEAAASNNVRYYDYPGFEQQNVLTSGQATNRRGLSVNKEHTMLAVSTYTDISFYTISGYTLTEITTITIPEASLGTRYGVAFSPTDTYFAVASVENTGAGIAGLRVYDYTDWSVVFEYELGDETPAYVVDWSADGSYLCLGFYGSQEYCFLRWQVSSWEFENPGSPPGNNPDPEYVMDVRNSPDGNWIAVGTKGTVTIYPVPSLSRTRLSSGPGGDLGQVYGLAWSPDSTLLAVVSENAPYLTVFQASDWSYLSTPSTEPVLSRGCSFTPDGAYLMVGQSADPWLIIYKVEDWTAYTPDQLLSIEPDQRVSAFEWIPDPT